jgi:hypothetical protein
MLEFHPKMTALYEGFRLVLEEVHKHQEHFKDACCVLHSEGLLISLVESLKPEKVSGFIAGPNFTLLDLLNDKFSTEFQGFLCQMLKIDPRKRSNID